MKKIYSPKKFYIKTFGCQANESDSSRLTSVLEILGMESAGSLEECDLFVINSCSVRQKSEDKVYGLAKKLNQLEGRPFVVLAGCMVGSVKGGRVLYPFKELDERTPWVDLYLSPSELLTLPDHLEAQNLIRNTDFADFKNSSGILVDSSKGYVNISYGCDNFCSYCVVPYARGKEISRSEEDILKEVKLLTKQGIDHITLCGQNVNSWGLSTEEKRKVRIGDDKKLPFTELVRRVHNLAGIEKLSFLSSNPFDFTNDLVEILKLPKIDNYLHVAVQSGNNDVLKKMNRRHTVEEFYELIEKIKKVKPNVELGTDIIVGFPSETREQFMDTVALFNRVKFNVAFIAMYSPRKGTLSEKMYDDDVSLSEKKWRHKYLTRVWKENKQK